MNNKTSFRLKNISATFFVVAIIIFTALNSVPAYSYESDWQSSPRGEGKVRLIVSGKGGSIENNQILAGLHIKLMDSWKTYWKHPGDSGMPVTLLTEGSTNLKSAKIKWPAPKRYSFYGLESWAYSKEIILPVELVAIDPSKSIKLKAKVKWAICDEICLFEEANFENSIAPDYEDSENLDITKKYLKTVPVEYSENENIFKSFFSLNDKEITFEFENKEAEFSKDIDLFLIEKNDNFKFPQPKIEFSEDRKKVKVINAYSKLSQKADIYKSTIEVTLANGEESVYFELSGGGYIKDASKKSFEKKSENQEVLNSYAPQPSSPISIVIALIFAFIGGLILNIMPCVLPVLSLKIMSILKHDTSDLAYTRKSFLYTTAGIIFSFLVLAIITITLKEIGANIGWGIQFQQPAFLIFLIFVMTLFTANMLGMFEVILSHKASDKLNSAIEKKGSSTPIGSFLTGAFATLMATPCTAPFLSTAIAFALTAQTWLILVIFFFIGLGLAFPYILVAIFPQIAKFFPKPGAWMNKIKLFLGFLLLLTIFWLLWVFFAQAGPMAFLILTFVTFCLFAFLSIANKLKFSKKRTIGATIYIILVGFLVPMYFANIVTKTRDSMEDWEKLSEAKLQQLIADGEAIFIDVTAEWCLTCQFNKASATNPMIPFMQENGVILMIGDYTNPSREIDNFLEKRGIYGIPYNIVYGPNAKQGIKLPELLKKEDIRKAILAAKNPQ